MYENNARHGGWGGGGAFEFHKLGEGWDGTRARGWARGPDFEISASFQRFINPWWLSTITWPRAFRIKPFILSPREHKVSFNDTITILRDIIGIHDY